MKIKQITIFIVFLMLSAHFLSAEESTDLKVVVTADRIETVETGTAAGVSVITAEDIDASSAVDIIALLETIPGVQFKSFSGPAQAQISMGGFGENSYGRVVVLVDGRQQNNPDMQGVNWLSIPLDSIERIEVLHGGGSVLYGSGAVGGVVNIITREADAPVSIETSGSYGSNMTHTENLSVGMSNALGGVRIGGSYFATDGYRDRSAMNNSDAVLSGELYPSDLLKLSLDFNFNRNFYEMPGGLTEAQFKDDPTQAVNQDDEALDYQLGTSIEAQYAIGDTSDAEILIGYEYKNIAVDMTSYVQFTDRIYNTFDIKPKFAWKSAFGSAEAAIVSGIDFRISNLSAKVYSDLDRTSLSNNYDVGLIAGGGYMDADIALYDSIGISSGVRYDAARISAENSDGTIDDYKDHSGFAWSAGLRWNPTELTKVYLRHERLFRYPFTDEQSDTSGGLSEKFSSNLEAERGYLYEVGGYYLFGKSLRTDVRAYLMDMYDEIAYVGSWPSGQNENLDATRRIGFESSVTLLPLKYLKITGTYGYVLPYFTNGTDEGNQVPLVSNHEAEGSVSADLPLNLAATVGAAYRSAYYQAGDNANTQDMADDYFLMNAGVSWFRELDKGVISLSLSIENILDLSYSPYIYYTQYYPAQGRSITVSGSYKM